MAGLRRSVSGRDGAEPWRLVQLLIKAAGVVCDRKKTDSSWDLEGLKTAVHVGGDFWSMEIYVPLAAFPEAIQPGTGVTWYGQLTRHRMQHEAKAVRGRENQKLNAQFDGFNSNTADFAPISFRE